MENKIPEFDEQQKEYNEMIRSTVADGSYFKDALSWYFFRYVTVICDRTLLIFGGILAAVVLYCLVIMLNSAFPLVVKEPIFIRAHDQASDFPSLVHLKPKEKQAKFDPEIQTVDEAVAKYLLSNYVNDREAYDFSKAEIEDVNQKFAHIRNNSSDSQYQAFQLVMTKENAESPLHNFGQNIVKTVQVESLHFLRNEQQGFANKALNYINVQIPTEAEIRFVATTISVDENDEKKVEKTRYLAKISFRFDGINKDENGVSSVIKFVVNDYQLFKIK
jgi:type IV secretory pathway component VirB8